MARATKVQIRQRVEFAKTSIVSGWSGTRLTTHIADKFDISIRQADYYIADAKKELASELSAMTPFALAQTIARLEALYKMCVSIGDFKTALDTLKEFSKLMNLYPTQKVEHTWKHEIRGLVNAGVVTREEVQTEFGDELAHELFGTAVSISSS